MKKFILVVICFLAMTTAQQIVAQTVVNVMNTTLLPNGFTKVDAELSTPTVSNGIVITFGYDKNAVKGAITVAFKGVSGSFSDDRENGLLTLTAFGTIPEGAIADLGIITETVLERNSTTPKPFALSVVKTTVLNAVSLQPNRVLSGGNLRIVSPTPLQKVALYDEKGCLVLAQVLDGSAIASLQLPSLGAGVYFVKINDEVNAQKIVVE